jgi:hypothetical protein
LLLPKPPSQLRTTRCAEFELAIKQNGAKYEKTIKQRIFVANGQSLGRRIGMMMRLLSQNGEKWQAVSVSEGSGQ